MTEDAVIPIIEDDDDDDDEDMLDSGTETQRKPFSGLRRVSGLFSSRDPGESSGRQTKRSSIFTFQRPEAPLDEATVPTRAVKRSSIFSFQRPAEDSGRPAKRSSIFSFQRPEHSSEFDLVENARKVRESNDFDIANILEREIQKSVKAEYQASTQSLEELQQSIDALFSGMPKQDTIEEGSRLVRFSMVSIKEYPIVIGDNPGGKMGAPITLGWQSISARSLNINQYEKAREGHRRDSSFLRMSGGHRASVLKGLGFTQVEIMRAANLAEKVRLKRNETVANLDKMEREEKIEGLRRNVSNVLSLGLLRREERRYLKKNLPPVFLRAQSA